MHSTYLAQQWWWLSCWRMVKCVPAHQCRLLLYVRPLYMGSTHFFGHSQCVHVTGTWFVWWPWPTLRHAFTVWTHVRLEDVATREPGLRGSWPKNLLRKTDCSQNKKAFFPLSKLCHTFRLLLWAEEDSKWCSGASLKQFGVAFRSRGAIPVSLSAHCLQGGLSENFDSVQSLKTWNRKEWLCPG